MGGPVNDSENMCFRVGLIQTLVDTGRKVPAIDTHCSLNS